MTNKFNEDDREDQDYEKSHFDKYNEEPMVGENGKNMSKENDYKSNADRYTPDIEYTWARGQNYKWIIENDGADIVVRFRSRECNGEYSEYTYRAKRFIVDIWGEDWLTKWNGKDMVFEETLPPESLKDVLNNESED